MDSLVFVDRFGPWLEVPAEGGGSRVHCRPEVKVEFEVVIVETITREGISALGQSLVIRHICIYIDTF